MKNNTLLLTISFIVILILSACSSIDITAKHEPDADFKKLKSFTLLKNQQKEMLYLPMDRDVFEKSLEDSFTRELTSKGFNKVSNNPDFIVSYYVVVRELHEQLRIDNYYYDIGYSSTDRIHMTAYPVGSLIVDILDTSNKKSIWRGTARSVLGEHKTEPEKIEKIKMAIHKLLNSFPPKQ